MAGFEYVRAFTIHVFTATGAALALLALILGTGGHWAGMFLCLGLALVVDGADGPLARAFEVQKLVPRWSGETLDLVVDFTTYVFVPAYAIAASGLLPQPLAIPAGIVVVISGALYFADREMKTADNYFRGFPAVWNLAAFYLYLLEPPGWLAAVAIVALAGLSFAPVKFLHPLRVQHWRLLNIAILTMWAVLALAAVVQDLSPGPYVTVPLSLIAVYFFTVGLLLDRVRAAA
ncbi:MAG TPA: CDP-alcohol phosphatidyltransferase family protein [Pseudolabrys sp.]|nr:CDP-alcohol phosphatidyltransferase family protein [Pseudolabrys sp.]